MAAEMRFSVREVLGALTLMANDHQKILSDAIRNEAIARFVNKVWTSENLHTAINNFFQSTNLEGLESAFYEELTRNK